MGSSAEAATLRMLKDRVDPIASVSPPMVRTNTARGSVDDAKQILPQLVEWKAEDEAHADMRHGSCSLVTRPERSWPETGGSE